MNPAEGRYACSRAPQSSAFTERRIAYAPSTSRVKRCWATSGSSSRVIHTRAPVVKRPLMRKRPLGKTGLVVSELAIGTWGLSGDAYGKVEEADAEIVLRRAIDMGFSVIDTADAYGAGRMERLVGKVLKDHRDLVVVTKVGIDRTTDPARKCFEPKFLRDAVERSLKRLA